jgi:phosphoribosylformylglycinamidine (FGAM) synthase-like amidotransferase family enzyme
VLRMPIKHGEGAYFAAPELLARLEERGQVAVRYCAPDGTPAPSVNPNGSVANIAGVTNERGNVLGMMPHPEHAVETAIGGLDGLAILGSLVDHLKEGGA